MDSAFSPLVFVIFGISISFYAFIVQSLTQNGNYGAELAPPAYWVSSPPPPPPPPPPLLSPSPPPPPSQSKALRPGAPPPHPKNRPYVRIPPPPHRRHHHRRPPPPPPPHKMNAGKKVGLLFVGIAGIMQIGVVGFLVIKRRQLLKSDDRYESCS